MPTYNGKGRGFLDRSLTSIKDQTYPNLEVIIVDVIDVDVEVIVGLGV